MRKKTGGLNIFLRLTEPFNKYWWCRLIYIARIRTVHYYVFYVTLKFPRMKIFYTCFFSSSCSHQAILLIRDTYGALVVPAANVVSR